MSDPVEPVAVPEVPPAQEPEAPVVTIGDIVVSQHWVVTPSGTAPIAGSTWNVTDYRHEAKKHPWWTFVLAIVLFPIGLLFLFITQDETRGAMEVTVTVDDPDTYYEPWSGVRRYRRMHQDYVERSCAENPQQLVDWHIPVASKPDF